jgi:hypothetical protein
MQVTGMLEVCACSALRWHFDIVTAPQQHAHQTLLFITAFATLVIAATIALPSEHLRSHLK